MINELLGSLFLGSARKQELMSYFKNEYKNDWAYHYDLYKHTNTLPGYEKNSKPSK